MTTKEIRVCNYCGARNNDEATILYHAGFHGEHPDTQGITAEQAVSDHTHAEVAVEPDAQ